MEVVKSYIDGALAKLNKLETTKGREKALVKTKLEEALMWLEKVND